jgi:hypothetical protein
MNELFFSQKFQRDIRKRKFIADFKFIEKFERIMQKVVKAKVMENLNFLFPSCRQFFWVKLFGETFWVKHCATFLNRFETSDKICVL